MRPVPRRVDPLEFLARVLVHIPDKGHVTMRYYGWYAKPIAQEWKLFIAGAPLHGLRSRCLTPRDNPTELRNVSHDRAPVER